MCTTKAHSDSNKENFQNLKHKNLFLAAVGFIASAASLFVLYVLYKDELIGGYRNCVHNRCRLFDLFYAAGNW